MDENKILTYRLQDQEDLSMTASVSNHSRAANTSATRNEPPQSLQQVQDVIYHHKRHSTFTLPPRAQVTFSQTQGGPG